MAASTATEARKRQTLPIQSPDGVVSVPAHLLTATERNSWAVKIQKVFRGYLVRKSIAKISSIMHKVEELERKISRRETVDLIRREPKERVRLNKTLMTLVMKLRSVRGVGPGVRDFRKGVIKKAVSLQERVNHIAAVLVEEEVIRGHEDDSDRDTQLLVKMMEDNEKMMRNMMPDLFERSQTDTRRVLNSLTQTMGQLEKVLACGDRTTREDELAKL